MSTIHNPSNFDPTQYEVLGYFDNRPPEPPIQLGLLGHLLGGGVDERATELWRDAFAKWTDERARLFGNTSCSRCHHCGQSNVRFVAAARHIPTGDTVCFGDICVERLSLPSRDAFKAKFMRDAAAAQRAVEAKRRAAMKFLEDHAWFAQVLERAKDPIHERNMFVKIIAHDLFKRGSVSEAQMLAVRDSMDREVRWAQARREEDEARAAKALEATKRGMAPPQVRDGQYEITGVVKAVKEQHSEDYGSVLKMMVVDEDVNKFWVSVPAALQRRFADTRELVGKTVKLTANWTRSAKDPQFAFGKRPRNATVV